jgi:predicted enzyme related to lactoylglutathione lyase
MSIDNAFATMAVNDLKAASAWYAKLIGTPASMTMPEVAEWHFPRGGGLQLYQLPERAGACSLTFAVSNIQEQVDMLSALGVDTSQRATNSHEKTLMIADPDGNHIAFAEAKP